ncbi:MAG: winged helix-turn-helix domain-containing protein [Anaerolineae bacterium]|nr:winged helix-turn-helix domain-containing protein [Anaerolineae bacterium]
MNNASNALDRWLRDWGFDENPFMHYEAGEEGLDFLSDVFVFRPYLDQITGDPAASRSSIVLADRGAGKTATMKYVASQCLSNISPLYRQALPVEFIDFTPILEEVGNDPSRITARMYANLIARYTLKALADHVPATSFDMLADDFDRQMLRAYIERFSDPISGARLAGIITEQALDITFDGLTPREIVQHLTGLIRKIGQPDQGPYKALYILIDRVDETKLDAEHAVDLLRPLVSEGSLFQIEHVAYKLFLLRDVGQRLLADVPIRRDRLNITTLSWSEQDIKAVLDNRVRYASNQEYNLDDLFSLRSLGGRVVREAQHSPRNALRLCDSLIKHHAANSKDLLIDTPTVNDSIRQFQQKLDQERSQPEAARTAPNAPAAAGDPAPSLAGALHMDQRGTIWVDGNRLEEPLSDLEHRLFTALYHHSPNPVPSEELIAEVWGYDPDAEDETSLRKLISRLRRKLEPAADGRQSRFIRNTRGRGYWLNRG